MSACDDPGCPSPQEIAAALSSANPDPAVLARLESCPSCAAAMEATADTVLAAALREQGDELIRDGGAGGVTEIAGYEIRGEIHRGGQGVVYAAWDTATRRDVAVKLVLEVNSAVDFLAPHIHGYRFGRSSHAKACTRE